MRVNLEQNGNAVCIWDNNKLKTVLTVEEGFLRRLLTNFKVKVWGPRRNTPMFMGHSVTTKGQGIQSQRGNLWWVREHLTLCSWTYCTLGLEGNFGPLKLEALESSPEGNPNEASTLLSLSDNNVIQLKENPSQLSPGVVVEEEDVILTPQPVKRQRGRPKKSKIQAAARKTVGRAEDVLSPVKTGQALPPSLAENCIKAGIELGYDGSSSGRRYFTRATKIWLLGKVLGLEYDDRDTEVINTIDQEIGALLPVPSNNNGEELDFLEREGARQRREKEGSEGSDEESAIRSDPLSGDQTRCPEEEDDQELCESPEL